MISVSSGYAAAWIAGQGQADRAVKVLAGVLLGSALVGWPLAVILLLTTLLGLFYNMHVMTWAVRLEE